MSLERGSTLGHYEIVSALGAGGMGEVYRARDTKLGREVAIKLLLEEVSADPDRLARFEREARMLASLNHVNVATLHGFEQHGDTRFLVMELVEGETLADRIARGPIVVSEAVPLFVQIAEGLEAAHQKDVVHRDLKPANIKLAGGGAVKILDFGLAKALAPEIETDDPALSHSPTLTLAATQRGEILGTAAYMAPEQARGLTVDKRADVWAFGCCLYEALCGRRAFEGRDATDTLAAVLRDEVEWSELPNRAPPALRRLLERCLQRDPADRLRDIGDARLELELASSEEAGASDAIPAEQKRSSVGSWGRFAVGGAVGLALGVVLMAVGGGGKHETTASVGAGAVRASLTSQERTLIDSQAISPGGTRVAFTADGKLWIRELDRLEARELVAAGSPFRPFWSPDGESIAYHSLGALWRVDASGGAASKICDLGPGFFRGGAWSGDGRILYSYYTGRNTGHVYSVAARGGEPEIYLEPSGELGELSFDEISLLPEGRGLLYSGFTTKGNSHIGLASGEQRVILIERDTSLFGPAYSPSGHLLFESSEDGFLADLWAVPFDLETLRTAGAGVLLETGGLGVSLGREGALVYAKLRADPQRMIWVDRAGRVVADVGEARQSLNTPSLSLDERHVAYRADDRALWVLDLERESRLRLTPPGGAVSSPAWSPDGDHIVFVDEGRAGRLMLVRADGGGEIEPLLQETHEDWNPDWSDDGRYIAFYRIDPETQRDIWFVDMEQEERLAEPFLQSSYNEVTPRISPSGRYLAYRSDESGRFEVEVRSFPDGDERWIVSTRGGGLPAWGKSDAELFFPEGNAMMVVDIGLGEGFEPGAPRRLFDADEVGTSLQPHFSNFQREFDVARDGSRFLLVQGQERGSNEVVLLQNWLAEIDGHAD
jgi:Tol biopolymer transport system component